MIRRLLTLVIGLVVVLILAAIIIPFVIPESVYRERAQMAASENLGREVRLGGDVSLQIIPSVQVRATDVTIANEDGFGDTPFAEMAELRVGVQLLPLLSRNFVIDEFVLVDPVIRLEQRGSRNNWTLGGGGEPRATSQADDRFVRRAGALPFEASLGEIRIENGFISYTNGAQAREIEGLDLAIRMPGLDQPLNVSGELTADGESLTLAIFLGSVRGFFEGEQVAARMELGGNLVDLTFDGMIPEGEALAYSGRLDATIPSLRRLSAFAGSPLPPGEGLETFELSGDLSGTTSRFALDASNAQRRDIIRMDDITGQGRVSLALGGPRPVIEGALVLTELDVSPYMPAAPDSGSPSASGVPPWSTRRMDLSSLALVDADLSLSVGRLTVQQIEISDAALNLALENARLEANLTQISLYDGTGTATFIANARTATPSYRLVLDVQSIAALPLLQAAAGFDRLSGQGRMNIDVLTSGHSQADLMNGLNGNGRFAFVDGAIRGVNLAQAIRGIETALTNRQLPQGFGEQEETDFSALDGTFTITNGIATNNDLLMLSPLIRVDGTGTINVGAQTMDYRLRPRAVASIQGQGGQRDLRGIAVPILISGTFNAPSIAIDWNSVGQALLQGTVQGIVGGDDPEDAIRNAIGNALGIGGNNATDEESTTPGEEEVDPAERLLRGLFGGSARQQTEDENSESDGGN